MLTIDIPGGNALSLQYLVLDYNGTLAVDGELLEGVGQRLEQLSRQLDVHVVTADTFGKVRQGMAAVPCTVVVLPAGDQDRAKLEYVQRLGAAATVCMGNGRNDRLMLKEAALGVAVIEGEGAAMDALSAADACCFSIGTALDLLLHPQRLQATLRV